MLFFSPHNQILLHLIFYNTIHEMYTANHIRKVWYRTTKGTKEVLEDFPCSLTQRALKELKDYESFNLSYV